ncbi:MAG: TetR/AcrR family transcriptional regulator [Myxococcales bacterium]|jgi:AcrR family transcriptional regulator|nr:TetR/AcrR family transcriptional regulator [Myxococcales bacterium]HIK84214.1 TetR/AcrR family transcriptional regulator [Myxococcales bacterium]
MSTRTAIGHSPAPRATRTRTRRPRAEREAQILDSARRIFSEKGYGEATVAEIASFAGVVEGTVYTYFASKRALLIAVMRVFFESLIAETETGLRAIRGVENQLRFLIRKQLEIFASDFGLCRVILREARPDLTLYDEAILELNRRYTGLALAVLEEGVATSVLRENIVPSVIRDLIYGGIEHAVWRFVFSERELDVGTLSDQLADSILGGIVCPCGNELPEQSETLTRLERVADRLEVSLDRSQS